MCPSLFFFCSVAGIDLLCVNCLCHTEMWPTTTHNPNMAAQQHKRTKTPHLREEKPSYVLFFFYISSQASSFIWFFGNCAPFNGFFFFVEFLRAQLAVSAKRFWKKKNAESLDFCFFLRFFLQHLHKFWQLRFATIGFTLEVDEKKSPPEIRNSGCMHNYFTKNGHTQWQLPLFFFF